MRTYVDPDYQRRKRGKRGSPVNLATSPTEYPGAWRPAPTLEEMQALVKTLKPACVNCLFYKCGGPGSPEHRA